MQISSRFTMAVHTLLCIDFFGKTEKPLSDISLYDVYHAVDCVGNDSLFHFHEHPCPQCPVGKTIHAGLDDRLHEIQDTMEDKMRSISLADVAGTMHTAFQKEA